MSYRLSDGTLIAKRVAGLPGEEVSLRGTRLFIDGREQTPPPSLAYLKYLPSAKLGTGKSIRCGDGEYIVLGDDARDSWDSRFEGPVHEKEFTGRPWLRIWPMGRFGFVQSMTVIDTRRSNSASAPWKCSPAWLWEP